MKVDNIGDRSGMSKERGGENDARHWYVLNNDEIQNVKKSVFILLSHLSILNN